MIPEKKDQELETASVTLVEGMNFEGAIDSCHIDLDAAAYPKIISELKAEGAIPEGCELRQVKYLNNIVEQDHRFIK